MKDKYIRIDGMYCSHCENVIKKGLLTNKKIKSVDIDKNIAHIKYEGNIKNKEIIDIITDLDYITKDEYISSKKKDVSTSVSFKEFILILVFILLIYFLILKIFGFNIFNVIPNIDSNITYGMLFVTGLLTSIHCISMCGAINLSVSISSEKNYKRPILYNLGRVISYTLIGGFVGLLGGILSINDTIKGIIIIVASIFMFLLSINMLGIVKIKFPKFFKIKRRSSNAFIVGLLNGFMPCGPLGAMQVYALSTGSFINGALSMLLFSLGTVPLMLMVGTLINIVKGKGKILINKIGAVLILILSIIMLNRGLLSLNIDFTKNLKNYGNFKESIIIDDYQLIEFDLDYNNYQDIIIQKGIPVKMVVHVSEKYLTGCNNEIISKDFDFDKKLEVGDNIIEFIPLEEGIYTYTCWMDMIKNNIKVIDDIDYFRR